MLFKAKEYNKIIDKSSEYIEGDYSDNARRIASYYIAKSYLATGDSDKAVDLLLDVAENIEDEKEIEEEIKIFCIMQKCSKRYHFLMNKGSYIFL